MKINNTSGRELTQNELNSIHHYLYYTDSAIRFACLREGVMVDLDEEETDDVEELMEAARACMGHALSVMPDVWPYYMDDGCQMVTMNGPVAAFTREPVPRMTSTLTFILRAECLEACEAGEIIAIVTKED